MQSKEGASTRSAPDGRYSGRVRHAQNDIGPDHRSGERWRRGYVRGETRPELPTRVRNIRPHDRSERMDRLSRLPHAPRNRHVPGPLPTKGDRSASREQSGSLAKSSSTGRDARASHEASSSHDDETARGTASAAARVTHEEELSEMQRLITLHTVGVSAAKQCVYLKPQFLCDSHSYRLNLVHAPCVSVAAICLGLPQTRPASVGHSLACAKSFVRALAFSTRFGAQHVTKAALPSYTRILTGKECAVSYSPDLRLFILCAPLDSFTMWNHLRLGLKRWRLLVKCLQYVNNSWRFAQLLTSLFIMPL
jgi:hypothetical protein